MGGQAFANLNPRPNIPRITPDIYNHVANTIQSKLETLFIRVTIPREAPGKADHGDVDFLVEGMRPAATAVDSSVWKTIKTTIGAELHIDRGGSHSFGLQHPEIPDAYIQVDVEISPGNGTPDATELFEWTRFMKSDSDLLQIIGVCHRPLGITCNDRGLHIRIEEIEPYNKKKALLFLTRDPDKAMEFYGLDTAKYWTGFQDEADLFDWVSKGRFFAWEVFDDRTEKSNDRSRQNKRGMYRRFVEDYMPAHPEKGTLSKWDRNMVLEEAVKQFGRCDEYQAMIEEHSTQEAEKDLWEEIKRSLPLEGNTAIGTALKGLRRWVSFRDGHPYITPEPVQQTPMWVQSFPETSKAEVLAWIKDNWQESRRREKKRAKEAKEAAMRT